MKTIIKIEKKTSISVAPILGGGVILELITDYGTSTSSEAFRITSGQAGALVHAIEQAEAFSFAQAHGG
jgi:hypothetical protein